MSRFSKSALLAREFSRWWPGSYVEHGNVVVLPQPASRSGKPSKGERMRIFDHKKKMEMEESE